MPNTFLFILHLSEFAGRHSVRLREFARKVKLVAKSERIADLLDGERRGE